MAYLQFISNDYFQSVANDEISGQLRISVAGFNVDVDTAAAEDVWFHAAAASTFVAPTAARIHNIASTAAADDGSPTGAGAWTVLVTGLNASYAITTETVTLNGTTNVATANSYVFIYELRVLTASTTAGNVGNITATAQVDGTLSCAIPAGQNRSSSSIFMVPDGYHAFIGGFSCAMINSNANATTLAQLRYKPEGANRAWTQLEETILSSTATTNIERKFDAPRKFLAREIIKGYASVSTNNTQMQFSYTVILQTV